MSQSPVGFGASSRFRFDGFGFSALGGGLGRATERNADVSRGSSKISSMRYMMSVPGSLPPSSNTGATRRSCERWPSTNHARIFVDAKGPCRAPASST